MNNRARFTTDLLRMMPRPAGYVQELIACRVRVGQYGAWEFDEDSPCFKRLRAKYADYKPTADDLFRVELYKAQKKAARDNVTRGLWLGLHRFCLTPAATNPEAFAAFLRKMDERLPCGECKKEYRDFLDVDPADPADPFAWSVRLHNAVNRKLGKREWSVEEATTAARPPL